MSQFSTLIFQSGLLHIGLFRCPFGHPHFANTGPTRAHLLVFPRTSVCITHIGGEPIVADPTVVMYYNCQQEYRRAPLSNRGDICEWFAFAPALLIGAVQHFDPTVVEHPERPFPMTHGPGSPSIYFGQRAVVEHILQNAMPDILFIEETMLLALVASLEQAYGVKRAEHCGMATRSRRHWQEEMREVQRILATRFTEPLTLSYLATAVCLSPTELCRLFRAQTGKTIHHHLNQIRLHTALEIVLDSQADLTTLALELGYSSHSHFTAAFRRAFGVAPSVLRQRKGEQKMRKNLIA